MVNGSEISMDNLVCVALSVIMQCITAWFKTSEAYIFSCRFTWFSQSWEEVFSFSTPCVSRVALSSPLKEIDNGNTYALVCLYICYNLFVIILFVFLKICFHASSNF